MSAQPMLVMFNLTAAAPSIRGRRILSGTALGFRLTVQGIILFQAVPLGTLGGTM
jgi:hypothetical protein